MKLTWERESHLANPEIKDDTGHTVARLFSKFEYAGNGLNKADTAASDALAKRFVDAVSDTPTAQAGDWTFSGEVLKSGELRLRVAHKSGSVCFNPMEPDFNDSPPFSVDVTCEELMIEQANSEPTYDPLAD